MPGEGTRREGPIIGETATGASAGVTGLVTGRGFAAEGAVGPRGLGGTVGVNVTLSPSWRVVPHLKQNRATSALVCPQLGHFISYTNLMIKSSYFSGPLLKVT